MKTTFAPFAAALVSFWTYQDFSQERLEVDKRQRTNVQVPRLMTVTKRERSGVLAGSGLQASSTTVVSLEVAKIGSCPVTLSGKVSK